MCCLILAAHTHPVAQEMLKSIQRPEVTLLEVGRKRKVNPGAKEGQVQAEATGMGAGCEGGIRTAMVHHIDRKVHPADRTVHHTDLVLLAAAAIPVLTW